MAVQSDDPGAPDESGIYVGSLDGGAPDWHTGHLVATNALVHDALVETLAPA